MILPRRLKLPLALLALLSGYSGLQLALLSLKPENVVRKDFIADYLPAKALLAGMNPYQPLPELNDHFQISAGRVYLHPTPHTPSWVIFSLPFTLFSYEQAARIWFLIEILCLSVSIFIMFRGFTASSPPLLILLITWAALGWSHIWEDLIWGQTSSLWSIGWRIFSSRRNWHPA